MRLFGGIPGDALDGRGHDRDEFAVSIPQLMTTVPKFAAASSMPVTTGKLAKVTVWREYSVALGSVKTPPTIMPSPSLAVTKAVIVAPRGEDRMVPGGG